MPSPSDIKASSSIEQEFDAIDAYLEAVDQILREGNIPDMSSLKEKIAHLCSSVQKESPEIQGYCLSKMGDLVKKLSACEEQIVSYQTGKK